jgi:hypothetical protein
MGKILDVCVRALTHNSFSCLVQGRVKRSLLVCFNPGSGIQTAMRHDTIMEGGYADYALVEGEARRVAKEAVQALKESRRQCWQADAGVPSWTGQSGALRSHNVSAPQAR